MLAVRRNVLGLSRWVFYSSAIFSLSLIGLAFAPALWMGLLWLVVIGFGSMKHMGATNTMIQTLVEDRMRGRVMAFYMMSFVGTMPFGSLIGGALADHIGARWTLIGAAAIGLAGSITYNVQLPKLRRILRPIYEDMGILEPMASST
jgi:MFS family permease